MPNLPKIVEPIIWGIEVAGVAVIVLGILVGLVSALYKYVAGQMAWPDAYSRVRHATGRALVLGLEFLVAAEIIRSINAETLEAVTLLGAVVIVRTFLSITVEMETEGRWPWQRNHNEG